MPEFIMIQELRFLNRTAMNYIEILLRDVCKKILNIFLCVSVTPW